MKEKLQIIYEYMFRRNKEKTISILFTTLFVCTFLFTPSTLSRAGDTNISELLLSEGKVKAGYFFISPVLATLLRRIGQIVPINCWTLFSVVILFLGVYIVLRFLNKRTADNSIYVSILVSLSFIIFFWELIGRYDINFTQTATVSSISGFLLIFDGIILDKSLSRIKQYAYVLVGVVFIALAGAIRWKALVFSLPFEAMVLLYWYIMPTSEFNIKMIKTKNKKTLIFVLFLISGIIFSSFLLHKCYEISDINYKRYVENNALRESICDYKERYPAYDSNQELFESLGIKESWINMIYIFNTSDKNFFTTEKLKQMKSIEGPSQMSMRDFMTSLSGKWVLWGFLAVFIATVFEINGWKNSIIPLICCVASLWMCAFFFVYIGRFEWRVTNGSIFCAAIALYVMSLYKLPLVRKNRLNLRFKKMLCVVLCIALISVGFYCVKKEKEKICVPVCGITNQNDVDILDYINGRKDIFFLYNYGPRFTTSHTIWTSHDPHYADNYMLISSCFLFGSEEHLKENYGISDLYADMITKNNVWMLHDTVLKSATDIVLKYLRDYYDENITVSEMDEYNEISFIRYTKRMNATGIELEQPNISCDFVENSNINICNDLYKMKAIINIVPTKSMQERYVDYYVNVSNELNGDVYTYGLNCSDKSIIKGNILITDDMLHDSIYTFELLGRDENDNITKICDIN